MAPRIVHYKKLYSLLEQRIISGELRGKLPSIAELTDEFAVSHNTVKKVLDQLKLNGLVQGRQGKGCFVKESEPQRSNQLLVGVWEPDYEMFVNPFFVRALGALREELSRHHAVMKYYSDLEQIEPERLAALVIIDHISSKQLQMIRRRNPDCRLIQLNHHTENDLPSINSDNIDCGYRAMEYLYNCGHRRIGVIGREIYFYIFRERLDGVRRFAAAHPDITVEFTELEKRSIQELSANQAAMESTGGLLKKMPGITAIFAFTDVISLGVLSAMQRLKLKVPQDISLISVDNRDFSQVTNPPLTTFAEDAERLGQAAADLILTPEAPADNLYCCFPAKLIERGSVRKL